MEQSELLAELRALGPPRPEHTAHITPQGSTLSSARLGARSGFPSSVSLVSQYGSDSDDSKNGAEALPGAPPPAPSLRHHHSPRRLDFTFLRSCSRTSKALCTACTACFSAFL